jgi:hypothetical protein
MRKKLIDYKKVDAIGASYVRENCRVYLLGNVEFFTEQHTNDIKPPLYSESTTTVHCKLDKHGHKSVARPGNGTGLIP